MVIVIVKGLESGKLIKELTAKYENPLRAYLGDDWAYTLWHRPRHSFMTKGLYVVSERGWFNRSIICCNDGDILYETSLDEAWAIRRQMSTNSEFLCIADNMQPWTGIIPYSKAFAVLEERLGFAKES